MKGRIPDLGEEPRRLDFSELADALVVPDPKAPRANDQRLERKFNVNAEIYRSGQDVHFTGHIAGRVLSTCPRCLDDFGYPLERDFRFLLMRESAHGHVEPDQGVDSYNGEEVDLSPLVREQALLALDSATLCSEACRGLCAGCGANLNHEACVCQRREG